MKIAIYVGIIFVVAFLLLFNSKYRYFNITSSGQRGMSENIAESKERGVFVSKYAPIVRLTGTTDSLNIQFNEAWVERNWYHTSFTNETIIPDKVSFRLLVRISPEIDVLKFGDTWSIGNDTKHYLHPSGTGKMLFSELYYYDTPPDSLVYPIISGTILGYTKQTQVLGELVFLKDK